jgi:hypothetical protein
MSPETSWTEARQVIFPVQAPGPVSAFATRTRASSQRHQSLCYRMNSMESPPVGFQSGCNQIRRARWAGETTSKARTTRPVMHLAATVNLYPAWRPRSRIRAIQRACISSSLRPAPAQHVSDQLRQLGRSRINRLIHDAMFAVV